MRRQKHKKPLLAASLGRIFTRFAVSEKNERRRVVAQIVRAIVRFSVYQ